MGKKRWTEERYWRIRIILEFVRLPLWAGIQFMLDAFRG
jgi:hypothetical protein